MKKVSLCGLVGVLALVAAQAAAAATIVVSPLNMQGWGFFDDNGNGGVGQLVTGPAAPPLGSGSAELALTSSDQGYALGTGAYAGTKLADITDLGYWSYQPGPILAISLQFDIRYHPADTGYQGRLVYEPYQTYGNTIGSGWQHWSPLDGKWWASHNGADASNGACTQSSPCTWAQVLANWPDASISGGLLFKAGSSWASFDGNVDALTVGVNGHDTTFNFEAGPGTKADCKKGGWRSFGFGNQGRCVSYVATGGRH